MIQFDGGSFDDLASQVGACLAGLREPRHSLAEVARLYEDAAEALRAHAILRLLIDADPDGFSTDLVMSGQARRAFLRRCQRQGYDDYLLAFSRSSSMLDAVAGDDLALAAQIFQLSPAAFRKGDEYEDDFWWQRFLGLLVAGAPPPDLDAALASLAAAAEGARPALAAALGRRDADLFDEAFRALLAEREEENEEDASRAEEELTVALGTQVFVEGVAVLKVARHLGIPIADEYPMCPTLSLLPRQPATPADEFSPP